MLIRGYTQHATTIYFVVGDRITNAQIFYSDNGIQGGEGINKNT